MRDEGFVDGEDVTEGEVGRIGRTRMIQGDMWMKRGSADEEWEVCPKDQHQHRGRGDET